ncbi:hypothetical protein JQ615_39340 [Bradyrhizobium jicamae]|uniref:Uncharacterized protein n=1 Tax=Bradyrhizobium jicamae TaxID=280332 RepID=A0ABS5FX77_9BRAD|nr:hypothetical protein [Bradyrhizobium jicamae]MBR0801419.1 hypothetical protein [Bradyrhizobium jicamae]
MNSIIHDDIQRVIDLADLLAILMAQPDAETAMDGMHKVAQIISEHAISVKEQLEAEARRAPRRPTLAVEQPPQETEAS